VGLQIGSVIVVSNTFTGNGGSTIKITSGTPVKISGNNLEGNKGQYDIEHLIPKSSLMTVSAQRNWWGITGGAAIGKRIYDFNDDYTLGTVLYSPVLTQPVGDAPAYVRAITLTPESPIGIQTVAFDVLFSKPMDTSSSPKLSASSVPLWKPRANMPTARWGLGVVAASNGKIYAIGGGNRFDQWLATVEEYDSTTDTWRMRTSMPTARWGLGVAAASNGKIYAIGGLGDHLDMVEEYAPETDTWRTRTRMPTSRRWLGVAAASNGRIYAIGGWNESALAIVEEYDPTTDTWRTRASMPTARAGLGVAAASNGKLYAIGGGGSEWGSFSSMVEEYDPTTDTWRVLTNMLTPRSHLGTVAASNGRVYAIGGNNGGTTVEEYTPATDSWRALTNLLTARQNLGVTVTGNDSIYAIGGAGSTWGPTWGLDTVEELGLFETAAFYDAKWPSLNQYRMALDITSLFPRGTYSPTVSGARGTDGIEIAPYSDVTFTVDYAGYISDQTPPDPPTVNAQVNGTTNTLSARWSAHDPDSSITLYQYAIGSAPGGAEVVNWTTIGVTEVVRSGLSLVKGQTYYVSVKARNEGGLWSEAGISNGVVAGQETRYFQLYLPLLFRLP
jgi:N-acetylneuraminic acid mutarotase